MLFSSEYAGWGEKRYDYFSLMAPSLLVSAAAGYSILCMVDANGGDVAKQRDL
ncbi:hypothetical protein [Dickeya zeae]|nr:hypothetical protein [Dickeya zeae]